MPGPARLALSGIFAWYKAPKRLTAWYGLIWSDLAISARFDFSDIISQKTLWANFQGPNHAQWIIIQQHILLWIFKFITERLKVYIHRLEMWWPRMQSGWSHMLLFDFPSLQFWEVLINRQILFVGLNHSKKAVWRNPSLLGQLGCAVKPSLT